MDTMHDRFTLASTPDAAAVTSPGGSFIPQAWQRLAAWRPVVSAETLMVIASIAFTVFYNHAFWHLLFS